MFVQMAESDIFKFTVAARNQEYLLRLFIKKKQKHGFILDLLETKMSK